MNPAQAIEAGLTPDQQKFREFCLTANDRSQGVSPHWEPLTIEEGKDPKPGGFFLVQRETRFSAKPSVVFVSEVGLEQLFGQYLAAKHGMVWTQNPMIAAQMAELAKQAKQAKG